MILSYLPGRSHLAALDARLALASYMLASISVFQGGWQSLAIQVLLCVVLLLVSGLRLADFFRSLGTLLFLVIFLTLVSLAELLLPGAASSKEAVLEIVASGTLLGARLLVSLFLVFLLSSSYPSGAIRDVLDWLIRPFSKQAAADFSLAVMVMLAGFPFLLGAGKRAQDAMRSRGLRFRRLPLLALRHSASQMLIAGSLWAKQLSVALAARGYGAQVPENSRTGFWSAELPLARRLAQVAASVLVAAGFALAVVLQPFFA